MNGKFISILFFISIAILSLGQKDSTSKKDSYCRVKILTKNADTLYTIKHTLAAGAIYRFTAYYTGTRNIKDKSITHIHPFCSDCESTRHEKHWYYNEKGQLTEYYEEKTVGGGWFGKETGWSVTKTYENGKRVKTVRTKNGENVL